MLKREGGQRQKGITERKRYGQGKRELFRIVNVVRSAEGSPTVAPIPPGCYGRSLRSVGAAAESVSIRSSRRLLQFPVTGAHLRTPDAGTYQKRRLVCTCTFSAVARFIELLHFDLAQTFKSDLIIQLYIKWINIYKRQQSWKSISKLFSLEMRMVFR